eukprot:361582-Chlamydomonas_euryale.AAC.5
MCGHHTGRPGHTPPHTSHLPHAPCTCRKMERFLAMASAAFRCHTVHTRFHTAVQVERFLAMTLDAFRCHTVHTRFHTCAVQVERFLAMALDAFEVSRLTREVPPEWRVHDSLVVLLRPRRPAAVE